MFGDTSRLQKTSIFFIGHGLAALAFVVSGVKKCPEETRSGCL